MMPMQRSSTKIQPATIKSDKLSTPATQHPIQNPLVLYLASLSPRSRTTMTERLTAVVRAIDTELDLIDAKGESEPAGRSASSGELAALVAACQRDPGPAGARDAAIFAALYIRRGEESRARELGTRGLRVRPSHTRGA